MLLVFVRPQAVLVLVLVLVPVLAQVQVLVLVLVIMVAVTLVFQRAIDKARALPNVVVLGWGVVCLLPP